MRSHDTCEFLCLDLPKAEAVHAALPAPDELDAASRAFKALGDPTRLAIALALRDGQRARVCDLACIVGCDERLGSQHSRQMRAAGLTRSERDGKMVMYELPDPGRHSLRAGVAQEATAA